MGRRAEPRATIPADDPLLVAAQEALDQPHDLESLARRFGYSPFHFHRLFTAGVGETPKQHVERLRLEKGWLAVAVTDQPILDIALAVGFQSHETFIRAFRRAYGETPTALRRRAKVLQRERVEANKDFRGEGCTLSEVRFVRLPAMSLIAQRVVGPYSANVVAPWSDRDRFWAPLAAWAEAAGVAHSRLPIGFFHDIPGITPPETMRSDFCLALQSDVEPPAPFRLLAFTGGDYAVIEHRGPYATIDQAYRNLADGVRRAADRWRFAEGAPMQLFLEHAVGGDPDANRTEVYMPISPVRRSRKKRQEGASSSV
jgi:AraC family transcriptional regulator